MSNFLYTIRNKFSYEAYKIKKKYNFRHLSKSDVVIHSIDETIAYLVENQASIARFGDGEIDLITGKDIPFQTASAELSKKMASILESNGKFEHLMIAIPDIKNYQNLFRPESCLFWDDYLASNAGKWLKRLNTKAPYFNAHVTRLYMDWKDKSQSAYWYKAIKKLWEQRDIVLVEGVQSRLGVGNDLFVNARSIRRILCPSTNSYRHYPEILEQVRRIEKDALLLLALGPTATVLAYDLFLEGYQAVDVGHIDIEYCWFLVGATTKQIVPGKYTAESKGGRIVADIQDVAYESQIVARIGCNDGD